MPHRILMRQPRVNAKQPASKQFHRHETSVITPSEKEWTTKVVFAPLLRPDTLRGMNTSLRIREATPSELFAERLEREATLASNPEQAASYRRQAEMLRLMAAIQPARHTSSTIH